MTPEFTAEDKVAAKRLEGLLDYVEALVKLDERPAIELTQYRLADGHRFILHQHECAGLPGIAFDLRDADGPIWLKVDRLQRIPPPEVAELIHPWVEISGDPTKTPVVREVRHPRFPEAEKVRLIESGEARVEDCAPSLKAPSKDEPKGAYFDVTLRLSDQPDIADAIQAYLTGPWLEWSEREKPRRLAVAIYQRLFEIAQRLLQPGGQESVELIWGIGLARWTRREGTLDVPMIERSVEIEIADQTDAAISIRPRATGARLELGAFEKFAPDKLAFAEDAAKRCLKNVETAESEGVSPFIRESFEPVLKICGSQLDPDGRYLPDVQSLAPNEPVPAAEGSALTVSDRYVLFARRRTANFVLRDIERFKARLGADASAIPILEGSARTLVMGPRDGVSGDYQPLGNTIGLDGAPAQLADDPVDLDQGDLFFPKPFNNDQVEIIRRLEKSDGLAVQGPPGTGKTHTIANIICHMLATGRRVLVVSHGETALRVIRDQLPDGVRDLAISVTTSEREGLKQTEKAIGLMLEIVNFVDGNPQQQRNRILKLQDDILRCRKHLSEIDGRLSAIATAHLSPVPGSSEKPFACAQRVAADRARFEWFIDRPAKPSVATALDENMIAALSEARKRVGADIVYLDAQLPAPANLPSPASIAEWHRDLIQAASLSEVVASSEPMLRRAVTGLGSDGASHLAIELNALAQTVETMVAEAWPWRLVEMHLSGAASLERLRPLAVAFLAEAAQLVSQRGAFLANPVLLPDGLPPAPDLQAILQTFSTGKNPFGLLSFRTKSYQPVFAQIRLSGLAPTSVDDWVHVSSYIAFLDKVTVLATRWRSLRAEFSISAEVDFDRDHLSHLDAIADRLQTALIALPDAFQSLERRLEQALGSRADALAILRHHAATRMFAVDLTSYLAALRLNTVREQIHHAASILDDSEGVELMTHAKSLLIHHIGSPKADGAQLERIWASLLAKLGQLRALQGAFDQISETCAALARAGAPGWAERLRTEPAAAEGDTAMPADWRAAWAWAANVAYLEKIGAFDELSRLHRDRVASETELRETFARVVKERTFFQLAGAMRGPAKAALRIFADIIRRLAGGRGQRAALYRQDSRRAMENCYDAVPCWIMPSWRVSEQLPASFGAFDLVILDEASQSDARELPALLRGKKILVVGDDRQVSPSAAFLSIAHIGRLRDNFLSEFPYRVQIEPGASLYDLARVMFPVQYVMLKEHFRCVEPIIRFSMQFYNEPLVPLRVPKAIERLDPPLIDIYVEDGERRAKSKVNPAEAKIIVDEIEKIINDPALSHFGGDRSRPRSIGVISLIGPEQAAYIQRNLMERVGETGMLHHRIACGDSATFQGDERDIIFLSMVADQRRKQSQTAVQYEQRFNVALSRARDRMFLVRSVPEKDLNPKDIKARVLAHFREPMPATNVSAALIDLCQSSFERDVFTALVERGYLVTPQVGSQGFSIDMVVEGHDGLRLAVECDGDRYHGPERWADDMQRQRVLERVGWTFWRCFGSNWSLDRDGMLENLIGILDRNGIKPVGSMSAPFRYTEHRTVRSSDGEPVSGMSVLDGSDEILRSSPEPSGEQLTSGDRVVVRFLDDKEAKLECYVLSDRGDDRLNGILSLSSPLAKALADATEGDEITVGIEGRERPLLFVSLEKELRQAA